jgi:hypothetical protein
MTPNTTDTYFIRTSNVKISVGRKPSGFKLIERLVIVANGVNSSVPQQFNLLQMP